MENISLLMQCLLLQALFVGFCYLFAGFQRYSVHLMREKGATKEQEERFHAYSFQGRALTGLALVAAQVNLGTDYTWDALLLQLVLAIVRGLTYGALGLVFFDGFLNRMTGKPFEYTGGTAKTDQLVDSVIANDKTELRLICAGVLLLEAVHLYLLWFF